MAAQRSLERPDGRRRAVDHELVERRPPRRRARVRGALRALSAPDRRVRVRDGQGPRPRRGHHAGGVRLRAAPHARRPSARSPSSPGSTRSPRTPASTPTGAGAAPRRSPSTPTTGSRRRPRRLVATGPEPDAAVDAKQELDQLCGAFGGLSESHHQILVLRELEGLSYKDDRRAHGHEPPRRREHAVPRAQAPGRGVRRARLGRALPARPGDHRRRRRRPPRPARPAPAGAPSSRTASPAGGSPRAPGSTSRCPPARRVAEKLAGLAAAARRSCGCGAAATTRRRWRRRLRLAGAHAELRRLDEPGWGKGAAGLAALLLAGAGAGVSARSADKRDERGTGYARPRTPVPPARAAPRRPAASGSSRRASHRADVGARRGAPHRRVPARRRGHPRRRRRQEFGRVPPGRRGRARFRQRRRPR